MGLSLSACFPVSRDGLHFGAMVGDTKIENSSEFLCRTLRFAVSGSAEKGG